MQISGTNLLASQQAMRAAAAPAPPAALTQAAARAQAAAPAAVSNDFAPLPLRQMGIQNGARAGGAMPAAAGPDRAKAGPPGSLIDIKV